VSRSCDLPVSYLIIFQVVCTLFSNLFI